jgi:ABC-type multidrug transport system ATPase subunit
VPPHHVNMSSPPQARRSSSVAEPRDASDPALLLISDVTKHWPKQPRPVLERINLRLGPGEIVWLTGENGAGKTTVLRIVAGIIAPDTGRVAVGGLECGGQTRRAYQQQIGLLTAGNSGLYARMTARQHLAYWARLAFVPPADREERIEQTVHDFALSELAARRMDRMSMGQRQRVRIAMAFLHRPSLVLLDEPANSLDDEGRELLTSAVVEHREQGGSAVWVTPGGDQPTRTGHERRLRLVASHLEDDG